MKRISILLISLFLFPVSIYAGTINYVGSSTVGKFIKDVSEVYKSSTFKVNIKSESLGGERCAVNGDCDIGGVARDIKKEFLDQGIVTTLIGKDAIAVIVNAENPIKALSSSQLKDIFTGRIKNWSELGGSKLGIKPMIVKKSSATRKVFQKVILGGEDYQRYKVITPDERIISEVSHDKGAIGQISFAFIKDKRGIRALAVDGQAASVNNSDYPITRPLYITTKGVPQGEVKTFLDWTLSSEGQEVLKQRFVGVK